MQSGIHWSISCDCPFIPQTLLKIHSYSVPFWSLMAKLFKRERNRVGLLAMGPLYGISMSLNATGGTEIYDPIPYRNHICFMFLGSFIL